MTLHESLQTILMDNKSNKLTEAVLIGLHTLIIQAYENDIKELESKHEKEIESMKNGQTDKAI